VKERFVVLEVFCKHCGFLESVEAMRKMAADYPAVTEVLVEEKANGAAAMEVLKGTIHQVRGVIPRGSKVQRALAVAHIVADGRLEVSEAVSGETRRGFLQQLEDFPGSSHDDMVDALTQALDHLAHKRMIF
jgi:predicted phage terminase large subunit-like protein